MTDDRPPGESSGGRQPREMWDLPLRGDERPPPGLGLTEEEHVAAREAEPPPRRRRTVQDRRALRRKIVVALILLLLLGAIAYLLFWPAPPKAVFHPEPMSMGQQRVGSSSEIQVLSITNEGERPMPVSGLLVRGPSAGEFEVVSEDCSARQLAALASCKVELRLTPTAVGSREAVVELQGDFRQAPVSVAVRGIGIAPMLQVSAEEITFGSGDVGSTSSASTVTVSNGGTAPLAIGAVDLQGASRGDFRRQRDGCTSVTLQPGEECSFRVVFSPRAAGRRSAEVSFKSDSLGAAPVIRLEGKGEWIGPALALSRESLDFGDRLVGSAAETLSVEVTNRHDTAVSGLSIRLLEDSRAFSIVRQTCSGRAIAPGEACKIEVSFQVVEEGLSASTLAIGQEAGTLQVELTGRGVAPRLALESEELEFGSVLVGEETSRQKIVVTNEGTASAELEVVVIEGQDAAAFSKQGDGCSQKILRQGDRCALEIEFRPRREGGHQAEVVFGAAELRNVERALLSGSGAASRLTLNLEMVEFGNVRRTTSKDVHLTASNPGTASLGIRGARVVTEVASDFRLLGGSCLPEAEVPPGATCTLSLRFIPGTEGRLTGTLELEHDGLTGPRRVPLAGTGLPPPTPQIRVGPRELDFGPQPVGQRSMIFTVTIRNEGTGGLEFSGFDLNGPGRDDFQIVPATCQAVPTILAGSDCTVGVRFVPSSAGPRRATLEVKSNAYAGESTVELVGSGMGGGG